MNLNNILQEIEANKENAETTVEMSNPATYGARVGLKRAATESIKRLKLDYRNELMASAVFLVVTGTNRDTFVELASDKSFECFTADAEGFYKDIASRINPELFTRESVRHLFNVAGNILEDKALELDIASYPMLMFNEKYNVGVTNAESFATLLKSAVNDQVGAEIVGINAVHSIVDQAIAQKHTASVTPVILSTSDDKFALELEKNLKRLTPKTFLVVAGKGTKALTSLPGAVLVKTVTLESVGEALSTIRSKI